MLKPSSGMASGKIARESGVFDRLKLTVDRLKPVLRVEEEALDAVRREPLAAAQEGEFDEERQVMTKCTLCVDRIHDTRLPEADRKPACVKACPTNARLFGDIKDPDSEVSRAIRERGGYPLMPEWDTQPANHYLPRQITPGSH